ncbi:MAG: RidA family protein [Deltaproteobacteria bacterium]|nr:RidA family protein [Deltaproteobacteria bacterium]
MQELSVIATNDAPQAIGPYSQAVRAGNLLFCSGQIPLDPKTQALVTGDIKTQTERVCLNLQGVLKAAGLDFSRVVKTTCFLKDMNQFTDFNSVYEKFFGSAKPARATVEVARLPKDVLVEIELVASF